MQLPFSRRSVRHGFTLIELLVVIAHHRRVDCSFAACGPGGARGRRRAQCVNNMKTVGAGGYEL